MELKDKNAIVTGGGRGIGRAIALALAAKGCNVAVNYFRHRHNAEETADQIESLGAKSIVVKAHIGHEEEAESLIQKSAETLGDIHILIGNAASGVQKPLTKIDAKAWEWTMNINARSVLFLAQKVVPFMRKHQWGRIITVTSPGSQRVFPDYGMVGTSKAALETITRYLGAELAHFGITANCISPGLVLTDALNSFPQKEQLIAAAQQNTPAGRLVTPEEIGQMAAWLCTEHAQMIVGQVITIDGGHGLVQSGIDPTVGT